MEYTDSEIREEIARLGYTNLSDVQLQVFKLNLMRLIQSERSKKSSMESQSSCQVTEGNISNHSNQRLESTNDYNTNWPYDEAGRPYSPLGREISPSSSVGHRYGTRYIQPDVGNDAAWSSNILRGASSEPIVRPKSVKWNLSRDSVRIIPPDEARHFRTDIRHRFHQNEGHTQRVQDYDAIERPASADSEVYEGYGGFLRKIPGIITRKEHPHTRNLVRTQPFERHQMYMRVWKARPPVCEASRSSVCRKVHNKLLQKDEIVRLPTKTLNPNPYIVPTDKPRYELRWAVRQCNENYEMPPCGYFRES